MQMFLGLSNFYWQFVKNYHKIAMFLTSLLNKNTKLIWSPATQKVLDAFKAAISSGPVLHHYDPTKPCVSEAGASDYALRMVCSQYDDEG